MSWLSDCEPDVAGPGGAVDLMVEPGVKDLGGFRVRRALPSIQRRMVGPFIFLDHMGPDVFDPGQGIDVRPHPHIGLATLTYLVEGGLRHRDTLGTLADIAPGDVNWMTAGRGIAHSERSAPAIRANGTRMQGLQSWIALPRTHEEDAPGFFRYDAATLPTLDDTGIRVRLIIGDGYGQRSPVVTNSSMIYADVAMDARRALPLSDEHAERAIYVFDGEVEVAGEKFGPNCLLVFRPSDRITVRAATRCRFLLLGGEPMDGPRHLWWNFVHSSKDRIESAKADWKAGKFGVIPGDDREFIPLPD